MSVEKIALLGATAEGVGMCGKDHSLGRGDKFVLARPRRMTFTWCVNRCLSTPESIGNIRRDLVDASAELNAPLDVDGAMHELELIYQKITGRELPSKDRG